MPPIDAPSPSRRYIFPTPPEGVLLFSAEILARSVNVNPRSMHIKERDIKEAPSIGTRPINLPGDIFNIDFILRTRKIFKGRSKEMRSWAYESIFSLDFNLSTARPSIALPKDVQKSQLASITTRESSLP